MIHRHGSANAIIRHIGIWQLHITVFLIRNNYHFALPAMIGNSFTIRHPLIICTNWHRTLRHWDKSRHPLLIWRPINTIAALHKTILHFVITIRASHTNTSTNSSCLTGAVQIRFTYLNLFYYTIDSVPTARSSVKTFHIPFANRAECAMIGSNLILEGFPCWTTSELPVLCLL